MKVARPSQEVLVEVKKAFKVFRYASEVRWKSGRTGIVCSSGKPDLAVSSPPEFKGEAGNWTPEDMFVASLNVCTMLTFLAYAQNKGLNLLGYESDAEGTLESVEGKYRFTEVTLRPRITLKSQADLELARKMLEDAHANCFIANSTTAAVRISPQLRVA
jgi:organic hydroperoxide reductase OsmC/OhrA